MQSTTSQSTTSQSTTSRAAAPSTVTPADSFVSGTRPLTHRLEDIIESWATSHHELVTLAGEFADSPEWILTGSPTAAHWLAIIADVEPCTAREWIRIGRCLHALPAIADAFKTRQISYSKVRTLTRLATPATEHELLHIATTSTAADLGKAIAAWLTNNSEPEEMQAHHHRQRSVKWRTEPDGMITFTLRLPPHIGAILISWLTTWVMTTRPRPQQHQPDMAYPSMAQQCADGIEELVTNGAGTIDTEVVVHVTGDGNTLDDGSPLSDSVVAELIPGSFIRALVYDSQHNPIDATNRRRHPTMRQKRLVNARDAACADCGEHRLLEYDHQPPFAKTGHTVTSELHRRCAPCHAKRSRR